MSNPQVLEYYEGRDRPHNLELVKKHFYEDRNEINQCIVTFEGKEIGYIQYYLISEEERETYGYKDMDEVVYGMDQFIGETDFWNQGIGTTLIKSMKNS